jgi:SAM-dependent methyltransferase
MSPAASTGPAGVAARSFIAGPVGDDVDLRSVHYGPDIAPESDLRLLGHQLAGKRILVLASGGGAAAVALARAGAKVIAVDASEDELAHTRRLAEREEIRLELHRNDVADLAFLRADTVDAVVSIYVLGGVADIDRVFRQVHRVLRTEAPFVLSLPHPAYRALAGEGDPPTVARSYFDRGAIPWRHDDQKGEDTPHSISDVVTGLIRANFRVDTLLEPAPTAAGPRSRFWTPAMAWMPSTLIVRARKQGL